ncbi:MAG: DEAD/DEAH box helicase [Desulfovibrionaceae bacterium]|nr:DEAD/DEAH box helicase [Desulfovibrionaceae bacterium]
MRISIEYTVQPQGLIFQFFSSRLLRSPQIIATAQWAENAIFCSAIDCLLRLYEEQQGEITQESLLLPHQCIANLSQAEAWLLGLPPISPLHLSLQSQGNMSQEDFSIESCWLTAQGQRARIVRTGSMLRYQGQWQRLPRNLYALCEAIERHNELLPSQYDEKRKYLAYITAELPREAQERISKDGFLSDLRVYHAAAFSLQLMTKDGELDFVPVLFGQQMQAEHEEAALPTQDALSVSEAEAILPPQYQDKFIQHFTSTYPQTRSSYVLGNNRYVFLDPMLQDCLEVVRTMRKATSKTRRQFICTPQRFIKEYLEQKYDEGALESIFVATQEYSERVIGLGVWVKKALPWTVCSQTSWIPESYGMALGEKKLCFATSAEAKEAKKQVELAIHNNQDSTIIHGSLPAEETDTKETNSNHIYCTELEIPANQETIQTIESIEKCLQAQERAAEQVKDETQNEGSSADASKEKKYFLETKDNEEQVFFNSYRPRKPVLIQQAFPVEIKTSLKGHQQEAWHWLVQLWSEGYSGALLADDMGLGKTLSCLTFLLWLRHRRQELGYAAKPVLIITPTSLVENWNNEANKHLQAGLGSCLVLRAEKLKQLRCASNMRGRDIDDGTSRLDTAQLQEAQCIFASYETVRDYHHSFAAIPFALIVYDEMQKAKNYTSQISQAIRTLNSEFHLGLTGTPVENSLIDLWSIMDVLLPGFLKELRQFNAIYGQADEARLRKLKALLEGSAEHTFKPMLRRMKSNTLEGLPYKYEHIHKKNMTLAQAQAYENALEKKYSPLEMLQALRMISLHPEKPSGHIDIEYYKIAARFNIALNLLDKICKAKEKVLIFLESRDHQPYLAVLLQKRYSLLHLPFIINGQTPATQRQKYVQKFQDAPLGFDVIILSPKAAGVGLTLTAANHVIHLSRWWNPAVEDQCTDRAYRMGQKRDVHVYFPLAIHPQAHLADTSFDLNLHRLLENKRALSRDLLLPPVTGNELDALYARVKGE